MRHAVIWAVAALLVPTVGPAQSRDEVTFMIGLFRDLQLLSFDRRKEYCGFVGYDAETHLTATEPLPGDHDSCPLDWPRNMDVIASYHTHGAFHFAYHNELPSDIDMLTGQSLGVDGWIATPGGRLWYINSERMIAKQVCGIGCLPVAPNFYKSQAGDIAKIYTHEELVERLSR